MRKKRGLYANIAAKRKRIAAGSGEKMRKPGSKGAPTAKNFKDAAKTAKKRKPKEVMGTRIVPGFCTHMEVDAESRMTETFAFMTPTDVDDFAGLMARLASGIEVMISVDDDDD